MSKVIGSPYINVQLVIISQQADRKSSSLCLHLPDTQEQRAIPLSQTHFVTVKMGAVSYDSTGVPELSVEVEENSATGKCF